MLDTHQRVSEEQLTWGQETQYHPINSVNLHRHLSQSTPHLLLGGNGLGHLYIHYTAMGTTFPLP